LKEARADYQEVSQNLDKYYAPHKALEAEIARLKAEMTEAEDKLADLKKRLVHPKKAIPDF
jgi:septal ring factor EnvC (AmiA/AmiB activator)